MRARGFAEHSIQNAANAADDHLASIQRAIAAGVTLVNGTDYPPGDLVDGIPAAVHELLLMAAAGLSPLLSLQSVSVNAAALLVVAELDPTTDLPAGFAGRVRDLVAAGQDEVAGALIPDEVLDRFAFSGTPEHVAVLAQRVLDAGAGRIDFGTPHGLTDDEGVALLGTVVLPRLRQPAG